MKNNSNESKIYYLKGSEEKENVKYRIDFLTTLFQSADSKADYIGNLRQRNLNYALIIFAALFTIGLRYPTKYYSLLSSIALLLIMLVFCRLDYRYHMFIHGWRKTRRITASILCKIINDPTTDIEVKRYYEEGEKEAEKSHLQPIIYYMLVFVGFLNLIYHLFFT